MTRTAMQVFVERLTNQYDDVQTKKKKAVWPHGKQKLRDAWMAKFRDIDTVKEALTARIDQHDGTTDDLVGANLQELLHDAFTEPGIAKPAYAEITANLREMFLFVYNHGFEDGCGWAKRHPNEACPKNAVQRGLGTFDEGDLGPRNNHDSY